MTPISNVSIALVNCEHLQSQIEELQSNIPSTSGFTIAPQHFQDLNTDQLEQLLLDFDILICDPSTTLNTLSGILQQDSVKGVPVKDLLVNVVSAGEDFKYLKTLIMRVALRKDGFENLAVHFKGDSMNIVPSFAAEKLQKCFKEDNTCEFVTLFEYSDKPYKICAMIYRPLVKQQLNANDLAAERFFYEEELRQNRPTELVHWLHWLNSFESLAIKEETSLFLQGASKISNRNVLIFADRNS
ncbi:hypothetical protein [Yersinia ruckeri]|uniref:hypothetical protein n=1 Tax=Yersinia ruckeri TaxID=29486 RepID=UPI002239118C|nr:hypothetical protein [Yersinia ruckeri]MCW6598814.1 hypothetical protein [Yersinia ruckeri]